MIVVFVILGVILLTACACFLSNDYIKTGILCLILGLGFIVAACVTDYHINTMPRDYKIERIVPYIHYSETLYLFYLIDDYGKEDRIVRVYVSEDVVYNYYKGSNRFIISKAELEKLSN